MRGVVPACRSLDAVSIFALTAEDAGRVRQVAAQIRCGAIRGRGPRARAARRAGASAAHSRFGVPRAAQLEFFGNAEYARLFDASVAAPARRSAAKRREVDIAPLLEAARLLYEGPWVAERYLATESLLQHASRGDARR